MSKDNPAGLLRWLGQPGMEYRVDCKDGGGWKNGGHWMLTENERRFILDACLAHSAPTDQAPSSLTAAIKEKIGEWRARLSEMERRLSSAYTGDAHALEEKQLEQCIAELEQLLARQAPGGVT